MRSAQQVQVVYELQVQEEREGVRQVVQEIERENQGEERRSHEHGHVDEMKDSLLEPRCVCEMMYRQERTGQCALRPDNVEVSVNGHVVIGVCVMHCHHAFMANS